MRAQRTPFSEKIPKSSMLQEQVRDWQANRRCRNVKVVYDGVFIAFKNE